MWICMCVWRVEDKLARAGSLFPSYGSQGQNSSHWFGGKHTSPLSHLTGPHSVSLRPLQ